MQNKVLPHEEIDNGVCLHRTADRRCQMTWGVKGREERGRGGRTARRMTTSSQPYRWLFKFSFVFSMAISTGMVERRRDDEGRWKGWKEGGGGRAGSQVWMYITFFSSSNAGACCEFECAAELQTVSNGPAVQLQALWVTRNERCKLHYYSWFSRP